jgi:hypothetical protein
VTASAINFLCQETDREGFLISSVPATLSIYRLRYFDANVLRMPDISMTALV